MTEGTDTVPYAINNRLQIVGAADRSDGLPVAFLWSPSKGFVSVVENAGALDINSAGDVVGRWFDCPVGPCAASSGFVWSAKNGFRDLGSFVPLAISENGKWRVNVKILVAIRPASWSMAP